MEAKADGSRTADSEVQVLTKRGFTDGPLVVQLSIETVLFPDERYINSLWLDAAEARKLGEALIKAAEEAG
jgi:hypothetical protein